MLLQIYIRNRFQRQIFSMLLYLSQLWKFQTTYFSEMDDEQYLNGSETVNDPDSFSKEDFSFILLHVAKVNQKF